MKKIRNIVIGGIENKLFNLILLTVILLSAANYIVYLHHSRMLTDLAAESGERQQQAISEVTSEVMDTVVTHTLARSNQAEARIADSMFSAAAHRVSFLADRAAYLFAHPEDYELQDWAGPDPDADGSWTAMVICADGVDTDDPAIARRIGLAANLSETMIALCRSTGAANAYTALPEGVHLYVSDSVSTWFTDGRVKSYDPREKGWYRQAAETGGLIFTEGEPDANTGKFCIECAAPVLGPDGNLTAVVAMDLYLDEMMGVMQDSSEEGEFQLLVNENGRAVLAPQAETFPMTEADRGIDLRDSENTLLSQLVEDALQGNDTGVRLGELPDGTYYATASLIGTTGWALVSAYPQETAMQPTALLQEQNVQIQAEAAQTYRDKTMKSRLTASVLVLVTSLLMLAGAILLGKRIVRPLNLITKRISQLREGSLEFRMEDAYRTGDEVEELAQSFASISHKTVEYLDTVKRVTAEKERIGTELTLATQIQASMLPHIVPAFPDRTDFDILGSMDPAREVGGDFYDYFLVDPDHLCMVIADVSGKGVPAALFMMASKIILQSVAMMGNSPEQILTRANEAICSNNEVEMFVTVWLGILELSTGKLTAANAGHEYPVMKHPDGSFELYKDRHGFVIGGMEGVRYHEYELQMEPGAKLFVYTDGVPEATDDRQELFGTERMLEALNGSQDGSPQEVLKAVRAAVDRFVKDAEQFDDITMLCLEYKGPNAREREVKPDHE